MNNKFDKIIDRINSNCFKYDYRKIKYGIDDILPLSVADMDFQTPPEVIESLNKVATHGIYGYTYLTNKYYKGVSDWFLKRYNWNLKEEDIVFCPRIIQAVSLIIQNFTKIDDKIGIFSPGYSPLSNSVKQNKRKLIEIPLILEDNHYKINFKLLREDAKVGVQFGENFGLGGEGFFRINIASPKEILKEGLERILEAKKI